MKSTEEKIVDRILLGFAFLSVTVGLILIGYLIGIYFGWELFLIILGVIVTYIIGWLLERYGH